MKRDTGRDDGGMRAEAVALQYAPGESAPVVKAKGQGLVAQRIVEIARDADVPVVEDAALVSALLSLELGQEIPAALYEAVARILAWVYRLEKDG
ncbi:MAG: EscU/YscU/HrcU family type III secretion system export apparatus switch protein [Acidobacteriota bacterium]|jgi:flagellar biosynthesis protein|nr:EscU/YscU/HrcU family type III secretion system export apparatus switch protein [Acidobacteriota bacterium]